ncbi:hypothetical protein [Streptomyces sp. B6B3]|uniref:hypothetical protein n=1 Tax=Streptomyces sp. B6B3 TaxID=3153570 RepID=UPI00325DAB8C
MTAHGRAAAVAGSLLLALLATGCGEETGGTGNGAGPETGNEAGGEAGSGTGNGAGGGTGGETGADPLSNEPAESGTLVEGDGWRGVLLETSLQDSITLPSGETVDAVSRVPALADVERFEELLPPTEEFTWPSGANGQSETEIVELNEDYVRQYTELSAGDHRQLRVMGICNPSMSGWQDEWLLVADGGSCFWDATMDLAADEITSFSFYGIG